MVYDGVGQDTLMGSLDCLAPLGLLASFGSASGPITASTSALLAAKGSLYVTRPTLFDLSSSRADPARMAREPVLGGAERRGEDPGQRAPTSSPRRSRSTATSPAARPPARP